MSASDPGPRGERVIELLVDNHPGAMSHVVGLFTRRAYNLEGVLCGPVGDGARSRMVLLVREDARLATLVRELERLYDVATAELRDDWDPDVFRRIDAIGRTRIDPG